MNTKTKKPSLNKVEGKGKKQHIEKNQKDVQPFTINPEEEHKINEARELLKVLSQQVKPLVDQGKYETINQAILEEIYKDENNSEFRSYKHWLEDNFQVRKGEKAYVLWAKPKKNQHSKNGDEKKQAPKNAKEIDLNDKEKFFPIAHVFSNGQVNPIEHKLEQENSTLDELDNIRNGEQEKDMDNDMDR